MKAKKGKKWEKQNRPNNKVISSSNLLSDKHGARDTLNFHYVALFSSKRLSRTLEHTHTARLHSWPSLQPSHGKCMQCNRSISNCPQSGGGEDFFHVRYGCNFSKKSEMKIIHVLSKKEKNNAEPPLCCLNLISV